MDFSGILRKSLHGYEENPVLLIPGLVSFLIGLGEGIVFSYLARSNIGIFVLGEIVSVSGYVQTVVGVFIVLGQVTLTAEVVSGNRVSLREWPSGIKRHFSKVVVIYLISLVLGITIYSVESIPYMWLFKPRILQYAMSEQSSFVDQTRELIRLNSLAEFLWWNLLLGLVTSLLGRFFDVCYACAVFDRKGLREALTIASTRVKDYKKVFFKFVLLFWAISLALALIGNSPELMGIVQPEFAASELSRIVSGLLGTVIAPLTYLAMFNFYSAAEPIQPSTPVC